MRSVITVIREQIEHFYLIKRLSIYELKSKNRNNYLGMAWEIINPAIQILIYWFVFQSIRQRDDVLVAAGESVPFIHWLLGGFILWIFFYQSTIQGSKSIYNRLRMLSKMNFPMSVIPNFVIFSQFFYSLIPASHHNHYFPDHRIFCKHLLSAVCLFYFCHFLFIICYIANHINAFNDYKGRTHVFKCHLKDVALFVTNSLADYYFSRSAANPIKSKSALLPD